MADSLSEYSKKGNFGVTSEPKVKVTRPGKRLAFVVAGELFFQKHGDTLRIPGIRELDPDLWPGHPAMLEVATREALVGAAQMNMIELHTWNSTVKAIARPDRMIFDLDPGEASPGMKSWRPPHSPGRCSASRAFSRRAARATRAGRVGAGEMVGAAEAEEREPVEHLHGARAPRQAARGSVEGLQVQTLTAAMKRLG